MLSAHRHHRAHRSWFAPVALFALLLLTLPVAAALAGDAAPAGELELNEPTLAELEAELFAPEKVHAATSCDADEFLQECEVTDACGRTFTDSTCCPIFTVGHCLIAGNSQMPGCYLGVSAQCLGF